MKSAIRHVPSKLPHADLYIDELIEIENIIKKLISDDEDAVWEGFEYDIDESTRLTTHEELTEHRGSSSNFELKVVYSRFKSVQKTTVMRVYSFLEPELSFFWGGNEDRWATYAQIAQIFDTRNLRLKNLVNAIPAPLQLLFGPVLSIPIVALFAIAFRSGAPRTFESVSLAFGALAILALMVVVFWNLFRPSRVYFRYARLDFHERTRARKETLQKVGFLVIGAILGCLGTIIASYFKKAQ